MNSATPAAATGFDLSIVNTIILVFFLVFTVWELLHGLRRGIFRQILHTGFMLASAVAAFLLTKSLWNKFFSQYPDTASLLDALEAENLITIPEHIYDVLVSIDISVVTTVAALPIGVIVLPIVFAGGFAVINIIGKLLCLIVRLIFGVKKGRGPLKRLTGLVLGAAEGALVASILLLPLVSVAGIVKDVAPAIAEGEEAKEDTMFAEIAEVCDGPVLNLVGAIGGNAVLDSFSTIKVDGVKVNLREDASAIAKVVIENSEELSGISFTEPSPEDKAVLEKVSDKLMSSYYVSNTLANVISGLATAVNEDKIPLELEEPYGTFADEALAVFMTTDRENLGADFDTILDIYFLLHESGLIKSVKDGSDPMEALIAKDENGDTVIARIIETIKKNERMEGLLTAMTEVSLVILADKIGTSIDSAEIYETVKDELNNGILATKREDYDTEDEYKEALTDRVDEALTKSNIELEPEIVEKIADFVDEEFIQKGVTSLDDEHFNEVILSYYEHYAEHKDEIVVDPDGGTEAD